MSTAIKELANKPQNVSRKRGCMFYAKRGFLGIITLLVVVVVVIVFGWSRGLIQFPMPTGQYAVGKMDLHLVDASRAEIFTDAPDDKREVMVSLYYPANPPEGANPAPFTEGQARDLFVLTKGTPGFLQDTIRPRAFANAPLVGGGTAFPIIIFSPGMGFLPITYAPTLEEIASHGYVVASISHPYSTLFTVFPDGRAVRSTPAAGSKALSLAAAQSTTAEALEAVVNPIGTVWVADVRFVLDQIEKMNTTDQRLAGRLDLSRVGIYGHSFGGGVAAETMAQDDRFKAGINMDGTFFGKAARNGVKRPFMLMLSERIPLTEKQIAMSGASSEAYTFMQQWETTTQNTIYTNAVPGYRLVLNGSTHNTFITFEPLAAPVLMLPPELVGKIPGERATRIIGNYLVSFFDKHVKGQEVPLLDAASPDYPEITFATK